MKVLILLNFMFLASLAHAQRGSEGVGGGHVVACAGKKAVTLDYYNAVSKSSASNVIDPETEDVQSIVEQRLNQAGSNLEFFSKEIKLGEWMRQTIKDMGPIQSWSNAKLKIILDHKLIYELPNSCALEQAAAQEDNGNEIKLYQNSKVVQKLSPGQLKVLQIHEALYSLVRGNLGNDSKPVRALLEKMLLKTLPDSERNTAISNFAASLRKTSERFVCRANIYKKSHPASKVFYRSTEQELSFYGKTMNEAFSKMKAVEDQGLFVVCNQIGDSGSSAVATCLEKPVIGLNCQSNY
jgi:hypothetical protein